MLAYETKLSQLRKLMKDNEIDVYYIPGEDAHQSEYIAPCDARRAFISGFTGSSGSAIVTKEKAALWTDGRYFLQAEKQLNLKEWILMKAGLPDVPTREHWIIDQLNEGSVVGVDPTLVPFEQMKKWESVFNKKNISLKSIVTNLVDQIWGSDRPQRSMNPIIPLSMTFCGSSFHEKLGKLREKMPQDCDGLIISCLDEIAWVLNWRGQDIPFNPVFFAYMWIQKLSSHEGVVLYTDKQIPQQQSDDPKDLIVKSYNAIFTDLKCWSIEREKKKTCHNLLYMSPSASFALVQAAGGPLFTHILSHSGIISIQKAVKNSVEMEGFRQCHIRDGAALVQFFAWLEESLQSSNNADGSLTEYGVAQVLAKYREQQKYFMGLSFDTISSVGPNAAIIHYKPEKGVDARLDSELIYLCDSGAQYQDGTTDVTRTIHFGQPKPKEKLCYTLVLKGHIALDRSVFPMGISGMKLDILARQHLWQYGLDYRHGTGHGVGHFLNVHEGPQGISGRLEYNEVNLVEGMTVTNEPGYYEDGNFGIRIENIMMVRKKNMPNPTFGNVEYFEFETVTMAPMCRALIQVELLCNEELNWLDQYHACVLKNLKPLIDHDKRALSWLERETKPFLTFN